MNVRKPRTFKRSLRARVLILLSTSLLTTVLFSWLVGSALTAPHQGTVTLPAIFHRTEISFPSRSGATLQGNFLQGKPGKGLVILMHGIRANRAAMSDHAELLYRNGHSVLLFDFQSHGESSGARITSGYLESMDAAAAVDFAKKKAPNEKIAVLGVSLGGAAAILADPPLEVQAMILELVYPDIDRAVKNRIELVLGKWARPFSPLLTAQLKWRIGAPTEWFSPERAIAKTSCPKLILAGEKDRHTKTADTQALFNAAPDPKQLWLVPNAAHESLYHAAKTEYEKRVLRFLAAHLSSAHD